MVNYLKIDFLINEMCFKNYEISYCYLNLLIFGLLVTLFSSFSIKSNSNQKIVGDLDLRSFSIIILILGILMSVYSLKNICKIKVYRELL